MANVQRSASTRCRRRAVHGQWTAKALKCVDSVSDGALGSAPRRVGEPSGEMSLGNRGYVREYLAPLSQQINAPEVARWLC